MTDLVIRSGRREEAEAYLRLWAVAGAEPSVTDDVDSIVALVDRSPEALLVAEQDGSIAGTLIAAFDGWRGSFYRLAVHPDVRRSGIAAALVAEGERRLAAAGCRKVEAIVVEHRAAAVGFWRAVGFQRDDRAGRYVRELTC